MRKSAVFFKPTSLAIAWGLSWVLGQLPAHATPPAKKPSPASAPMTLNFVNADIESVARTLATVHNRNVVVDPRVKGTINLNTEQAVSPNEAWEQFSAALRLQGFAIVQTKGLYKIVPEADAKLQGGNVEEVGHSGNGNGAGQIVTHIFKLNFEQANNLVPVLRPLISPNNTLNVNPGNNSLVITDYADNLQRIGRIIAALDVANASDVEVIHLKHAVAIDLAPLVQRLVDAGNLGGPAATPGQAGQEYRTTLLADPRSNSLILRAANPARVALVKALVSKLDQPSGQSASGNIHVVYLKNADATKLASTLRAALSGQSFNPASSATPTLPANPVASALPTPAVNASGFPASGVAVTGGQIQADTATNSLIITAPEPQYRQLRAVIDMLDQRRAQVMVESLIAEVNADKAAQMGFQWQGAVGSNSVMGTNFGTAGNIIALAQGSTVAANAGVPGGLNVAQGRTVNGRYVLGSLANFLETNVDGNILSTPTLMTLDNEEAKIVVGKNISVQTGNVTLNNNSASPFTTYERKDVGLTLRVKPQISETGTVKLNVYQEVSDVIKVNGTDSVSDRAFSKRAVETNVLVEDGGVVVLGGLLSESFSGDKSQIPWAGDIPLLGALFRNENRTRNKTNLMIFLRPVVLRDADATEALSTNRYQQMLGQQQNAQPGFHPILGTGRSPVLPALPAKASPPKP